MDCKKTMTMTDPFAARRRASELSLRYRANMRAYFCDEHGAFHVGRTKTISRPGHYRKSLETWENEGGACAPRRNGKGL